jgi:hypothetical protein
MTKRSDRRADYRHFPPEYGEAFRRRGRLGPMTYADAKATTRELYRFRTYLMSAIENDPADTFAREMYDAARDVSLSIDSINNVEHFVVFRTNPVVAAMRLATFDDAASDAATVAEARESIGQEPLTKEGEP